LIGAGGLAESGSMIPNSIAEKISFGTFDDCPILPTI
tara:strand:+ start:592 stop:702 length:111 start_codon:yes stop_codon:yes gene_type:complete